MIKSFFLLKVVHQSYSPHAHMKILEFGMQQQAKNYFVSKFQIKHVLQLHFQEMVHQL